MSADSDTPGAAGPPSGDFKGRVVLVTGAGSRSEGVGNGRATAVLLARAGARLGLIDERAEWARETHEWVRAEGGEAVVVAADVADPADCERAVADVVAAFGSVYGLVNNVVIGGPPGTALDVDPDSWDLGMQVNVKSMMLMSKYCLPHMIEAGTGSIVNISSVAGLRGGIATLLYPTSKAAVVGLTRAMAAHHGPDGVRVNCVAPGMVYTPMVAGRGMTSEVREARRRRSLLGTEGSGWDVGAAVRYLLGDEARWVTGVTFPVDAGASAGSREYPALPAQLTESTA